MARVEFLHAHYSVTCTPDRIEARAQAMAIEQSVEMPVAAITKPSVVNDVVGRVEAIEEIEPGRYRVVLGLSAATVGVDPGQLMNMLFGNISLQDDVQFIDFELPAKVLRAFPGPRFGIEGIRAALGASDRALTATALKPQGLSAAELAKLCGQFARAGIDIIKDDHGIADQCYAPFVKRVPACQRAVAEINRATGARACYAPNLSGGPRALAEQARILREEGCEMALAAPMILGLASFQEIAERVGVPILAHPAFGGAARIRPALLIGKLFRLFGADAVIFPNYGGRFSYSPELCRDLAQAARKPWEHIRRALPTPAGGMSVGRVPEMLSAYGADTLLLIGGDLLRAGDALVERSREFVEMVARYPSPQPSPRARQEGAERRATDTPLPASGERAE
jgi:ribulose-bisphosphate carboxylase large chain